MVVDGEEHDGRRDDGGVRGVHVADGSCEVPRESSVAGADLEHDERRGSRGEELAGSAPEVRGERSDVLSDQHLVLRVGGPRGPERAVEVRFPSRAPGARARHAPAGVHLGRARRVVVARGGMLRVAPEAKAERALDRGAGGGLVGSLVAGRGTVARRQRAESEERLGGRHLEARGPLGARPTRLEECRASGVPRRNGERSASGETTSESSESSMTFQTSVDRAI